MEHHSLSFGAKLAIWVSSIAALTILLCTGAYFALVSGMPFGRILEHVRVAGVELGGMSYSQALEAVQQATQGTYGQTPMSIQALNQTFELPADLIGTAPDLEDAVKEAYAFGRAGWPEKRQQEQLIAASQGYDVNILPYLAPDAQRIHDLVYGLQEDFQGKFVPSSVKVIGDTPDLNQEHPSVQILEIHMGTPGQSINVQKLYDQVLTAYNRNRFTVTAECSRQEPKPIRLDSLYKNHYKAPVDAVMDPKTFQVTSHCSGYDFDLELAKRKIEAAKLGDTLRIPFRILSPEITKQKLEGLLFRDVLATHTATAGSIPDRNVNLKLSCQAIDGTVLMPGQVFSYNEALGERTPDKGWKQAAGYVGNKTVQEYGGGNCQASSCLYYAALQADLKIVTRVAHGFVSSYMPLGMDATVSWNGPHFRFKNNTPYPLRIDASASGGAVTVSLVGTDIKDYYVKMEYEVLDKEDYQVVDKELPPNNKDGFKEGDVITTPYTGYTVTTYRCKYSKETDKLISREKEATSHYSRRDKEICKIVIPEPTQPNTPYPTTPPVPTVPTPTVPTPTVPETTVPAPTVPAPTIPEATTPVPTMPEQPTQPTVPETTAPPETTEPAIPETTAQPTEPAVPEPTATEPEVTEPPETSAPETEAPTVPDMSESAPLPEEPAA